jgi:integrase
MGRQTRQKPGEKARNGGITAWAREGGNGKVKRKQFANDSTFAEREAWRESIRGIGTRADAGTFAADVAAYLPRISAMASAKAQAANLERWMQELGRDRPRSSITPEEIEIVMQKWLTTPTPPPAPGERLRGRPSGPNGLSVGAVETRKTALQAFFTRMNGKHGDNPARRATLKKGPRPALRAIDYRLVKRILEAMPTERNDGTSSCARVRAAVMAFTGIPPALMMTIRKGIDLYLGTRQPWVRVHARTKTGVESRQLPLTAQGRAAFIAFDQADAYGYFAVGNVNRAFKAAARKVDMPIGGATLYALRHSFGAEMYRTTHDLATVGRLMNHAEGETRATARYAAAANEEVNLQAAAKFSKRLGRIPDLTPTGRPRPRRLERAS